MGHPFPRSASVALVLAAALSACAKDETHPEYAGGDCTGKTCASGAGAPVGGGSKTGGSDDAGGAEERDGAFTDAERHSLSGNVGVYTDALFEGATAYAAEVRIGVTSNGTRVAGTASGGTYAFDDVTADDVVWLDLSTVQASADVLPTIAGVDGTLLIADVAFAPVGPFDQAIAGLTRNVSRRAGYAQVVVTFVDSSGNPAPGVEVLEPIGDGVAYDDGGQAYSDLDPVTKARGKAIITNVRAIAPLPATSTIAVSYKSQGLAGGGTATVRVAQNAVTFVSVLAL